MKFNNQLKIILMTLVIIAPISGEPPLSIPTARPLVRRKATIKDVAVEIIQINQHIDELTRLRTHIKNQREIARILKDIDTLKTLRDLKIRELNILRQ